jgi:prepilin-type N-terminal cleavage/methylation domain-containing protein
MQNLGLKIISLIRHPSDQKGFTLTESLVSMIILSITLTVMFPAFMIFAMENADKRNISDAIALSNNVLDNLRRSRITTVPLGNTITTKEYSGKTYRINQYVCVELSNVNTTTPTCNNASSNSYPSRDILIRIEKGSSPHEKIYQVETVFSSLR